MQHAYRLGRSALMRSYRQSPILFPACVSDMVMFLPPMFILMVPRFQIVRTQATMPRPNINALHQDVAQDEIEQPFHGCEQNGHGHDGVTLSTG